MQTAVLSPAGLADLVEELHRQGRRVIGPTLRGGALVLGEIAGLDDLPRGVHDEQGPGHYRAAQGPDDALFGHAAPAHSAKGVLFPPDELLWRGTRAGSAVTVHSDQEPPEPIALLGIPACDLAAVAVQDRVLLTRSAADVRYAARRRDTLLVAVTCARPAGTCFCASMGTGPKPGPGADLVLTELLDGEQRFLAEAGSPVGERLLDALPTEPATPADLAAAAEVVGAAVASMGRSLRTDDLRDLLRSSTESPHWAQVAERCLACANCTLVCPTCFCTSVEDVTDLAGDVDERHRVWDSCFVLDHSALHGGAVRTSIASRYRQWLTHKLDTWTDQFGVSGCVGCGRCITWCPAGIDLTEEVAALRGEASARAGAPSPDAGPRS